MMDLAPLKEHLCSLVDDQAKAILAANPTHTQKLEEARDILDQADDQTLLSVLQGLTAEQMLSLYPLIATGIGIDGPDLISCARKVHEAGIKSRARTALVERTRRLARQSINNGSSKEACEAAYKVVRWPPEP